MASQADAKNDAAHAAGSRSGAGPSDAALVVAARAAEPWAREALFRRYAPMANGLALRLMGRDADIDDLVQDSFVAALRGLGSLKEPQAFAGWLASIVVQTAHKLLRRRRLARRLGLYRPEPIDADALVARDAPADAVVELRALYAVLEELPPRVRVPLVLRRVEGHSLDEVAELTGTSLATVKRAIAEGERRLEEPMGRAAATHRPETTMTGPLARHVRPTLGEARLARQWSAIDARSVPSRAGSHRWRGAALAWCAAALAITAVYFARGRGHGARDGMEGTVIENGTVTLADGSHVAVSDGGRVHVETVRDDAVVLSLDSGSVEARGAAHASHAHRAHAALRRGRRRDPLPRGARQGRRRARRGLRGQRRDPEPGRRDAGHGASRAASRGRALRSRPPPRLRPPSRRRGHQAHQALHPRHSPPILRLLPRSTTPAPVRESCSRRPSARGSPDSRARLARRSTRFAGGSAPTRGPPSPRSSSVACGSTASGMPTARSRPSTTR